MGAALLNLGELVLARHHFEEAVAIDEHAGKPSGTGDVSQLIDLHSDLSSTLPRLAQTLWLLGFPDQARQRSVEVDALSKLSFSPISHAFVHQHIAMLNQWLGNTEEVRIRSQAIMALTTQYELSFFHALGILFGGWVLVAQEQIVEGTAQLRRALALLQDQENTVMLSYNLSLLATAYAQTGQANQALTTLDEALTVAAQTDDHVWDAELHRQKGELLLSQQANHSEVEYCFQEAISVARSQRARSLELRATMSLSRLWQRQGKQPAALQMVSEIYNWFSEGFDTPDLQAARALLDALT
jgi:predicted ATPase